MIVTVYVCVSLIAGFLIKNEIDIYQRKKRVARKIKSTSECMMENIKTLDTIREMNAKLTHAQQQHHADRVSLKSAK
jgi:hypothetical protein